MLNNTQNDLEYEYNVKDILDKDGVDIIDVDNVKTPVVTSLEQLRKTYPAGKSWAKRIINTHNSAFFNSATFVCQNKNEGIRRHKHPDCDEFWVIMAGKMKIEVGDDRKEYVAAVGDLVYLKKNTFHKLTVISDEPGIRLSVSVECMHNFYAE